MGPVVDPASLASPTVRALVDLSCMVSFNHGVRLQSFFDHEGTSENMPAAPLVAACWEWRVAAGFSAACCEMGVRIII